MYAENSVLVIQIPSSDSQMQANPSSRFTLSLDRVKRELGVCFYFGTDKMVFEFLGPSFTPRPSYKKIIRHSNFCDYGRNPLVLPFK